jgi:4-amino-4-deoxy-L-arabinose transferase-like glycosyltransferase
MTTRSTDTRATDAWHHALWLIGAATLLRLLLGTNVPLFADEAYYWVWSRNLAAGYFDHPPAIAWVIAAGTALFGDSPIGVRFVPILLGGVATLALASTARHLAGDSAARFAALLMAVMPLSAAGFVLATPDAPLFAAVSVTLLCVVRAVDAAIPASTRLHLWLAAGLAIGLAMASKFTGIFVPIGALVAVVLHRDLRPQLREPGPWLAVLVASLVMLPVLHWNRDHDWITFRFQLSHGLGTTPRGTWWQRELDLLGGQLGLISPVLALLLVQELYRAYRPTVDPRRFLLAQVALFSLGFFVYSATRKSVEANWPAIGWVPALVLLAAARPALRTRWDRRAIWVAGVLTIVALSQVLVPWWPLPARRDPVAKAHGWESVAASIDSLAAAEGATPASVHVAANRYQDAALLTWYLPDHPAIPSLNLGARRNQYDLWPRVAAQVTEGATLLVVLDERADAPDELPTTIVMLSPHFQTTEQGPLLPLERGGDAYAYRRLWILRAWQGGWPDDPNDLLQPLPR